MDVAEAPHTSWPKPLYAWYVVGVLLTSYAFAILDRIALGLLVQPIQADLGLSDTEMGLLQGAAFGIFYSLFAIPIGYLADQRSRRWILAIGISLWSGATILCAFARGFGGFFLGRIGVGVGEASVSPASSSLIADYFPPEKRGKAYGIFMMGSTLGIGMAYLIGAIALASADTIRAHGPAWISTMQTWQITFFLIGAPGLLLALLILATVREPVRREKLLGAQSFSLGPVFAILKANSRPYVTVIFGTVCSLICVYAQLGWLPTVFIRIHGWSAAEVSTALAIGTLPVGAFSAFAAGWLLSWLTKRGRADAPIIVMICHAALLATFGTFVGLAPSAPLAYTAYMIVSVAGAWSYAATLAALNQITPNEMRGQMTGVYTLVTGLVSMGVGTFAVGLLSDTIFPGHEGIGPSLAVVHAAGGLIAVAILLSGIGSFRAAVARAAAWTEKT